MTRADDQTKGVICQGLRAMGYRRFGTAFNGGAKVGHRWHAWAEQRKTRIETAARHELDALRKLLTEAREAAQP